MLNTSKPLGLVCFDGLHDYSNLVKKVMNNINLSFVSCGPVSSLKAYNLRIIRELQYATSDYIMVIQYDGYPLNYSAWDNRFLDYDYIGAPWINQPWPRDISVGNGGFSIRSRKLMERVAKFDYDGIIPEDVFICREKGRQLQQEGFKFAPIEVAYMFSVEDTYYKGQFGFHGKNTITINKAAGIFK